MTFSDIFKSSFLESVKEFSAVDTLIGMAFALVLGLFIFLIYRKTFAGVMYSTGFAMSLVGLSLVTTLVIMAVTSNVVLSLGMVGALSIVRFRAAIKEPMEIVFLFWSLAAGIVIGAGMIPLAVIGSIIIGVILLILSPRQSFIKSYLLIVNCADDKAEEKVRQVITDSVGKSIVRSKTVTDAGIELTTQIRIRDGSTDWVNRVKAVKGVSGVTLVTFNGEYMS